MKKSLVLLVFILNQVGIVSAQDINDLVNKVKAKLNQVNDYVAQGILKTDVSFIKAPAGKITIYFKKPDHFKLKKEKGISILPKGGISITMNSIITTDNFVALAAGESVIDGTMTKIVKLLPANDSSDIILSTLYIDQTNFLIKKAVTTTKENGTYEINMTYGKYSNFALPDKVIFSFNTKDYKLPKGITLELDENEKPSEIDKMKNKKGKIEITYTSYIINKGVDEGVFK